MRKNNARPTSAAHDAHIMSSATATHLLFLLLNLIPTLQCPKLEARAVRGREERAELGSHGWRHVQARHGLQQYRGVGRGRVDERARHAVRPAEQAARVIRRVLLEDLVDLASPAEMRGVLAKFKEFVVAERLSAIADFPVFYFFDELREAFPRAAVLLSSRNDADWARARRLKNNLVCREFVSEEPMPPANAAQIQAAELNQNDLAEQLAPPDLPHPFALLPCLERQLLRQSA